MMKDTATLKELLAIVVRRGKMLLILALVFALVLGGIKGSQLAGQKITPEQAEQNYLSAMETYRMQREQLEKKLADAQCRLEAQRDYNEKSILLSLAAFDVDVTTVHYAISDAPMNTRAIAEEDQKEETTYPQEYVLERIQDQYLMYWDTLDLGETIGQPADEDKYIRELVSVEKMPGGVLTIRAMGVDAEASQALAKAAAACLEDGLSLISAGSYSHRLVLLGQTTKSEKVEVVSLAQEKSETALEEAEKGVTAAQKALSALAEPQQQSVNTVISICKWAVLGAVVGMVLGIIWAILAYLLRNCVETSRDLEKALKLEFLGANPQDRSVFARWADAMLRERRWKNTEEGQEYIRQKLKLCLNSTESVALITTLKDGESRRVALEVIEILGEDGRKAVLIGAAVKNPNTETLLAGYDKVILAEAAGQSNWDEVAETVALVAKHEKELCGFVMI